MADITGFQIEDVVGGGSASNGQDVWFSIKVSDGKKEQELTFFAPQDWIHIFLNSLQHFAGMARSARLALNPQEEEVGQLTGAHAFNVSKFTLGDSSEPQTTILCLQTPQGLNSYFALSLPILRSLTHGMNDQLAEAETSDQKSSPDDQLH